MREARLCARRKGADSIGDTAVQFHPDQLSTAVLLFDGELRLCHINLAGEDLLLLSRRHVLGLHMDELRVFPAAMRQAVLRVLADGRVCQQHEMELGQDIAHRMVDCVITPVFVHGGVDGVVIELHDVGEFLRISNEENLRATSAAVTESLRGIAHEIRNPLGGIRGAAQLLDRKLRPEQTWSEYTGIIMAEVDRLREFVDHLLSAERPIRRQMVNIHELLQYVISLVSVEGTGLKAIQRDYDPSLPEAHLDRGLMVQVLLNLLRNARQAAGDEGNIHVRTRIRHQQGMAVCIEIRDDGPGIAPEMCMRVFYPLVTRSEGTGLGLAIAQKLVHMHEGTIEYERVDGLSCFRILLPLAGNAVETGEYAANG